MNQIFGASILAFALIIAACTTDSEPKNLGETFALRVGEVQKNHRPFPLYTPIYVDIFKGEVLKESRLGYRAWDFNHDGRFDMVESIRADGSVQESAYDFNYDGVIDERSSVKNLSSSL